MSPPKKTPAQKAQTKRAAPEKVPTIKTPAARMEPKRTAPNKDTAIDKPAAKSKPKRTATNKDAAIETPAAKSQAKRAAPAKASAPKTPSPKPQPKPVAAAKVPPTRTPSPKPQPKPVAAAKVPATKTPSPKALSNHRAAKASKATPPVALSTRNQANAKVVDTKKGLPRTAAKAPAQQAQTRPKSVKQAKASVTICQTRFIPATCTQVYEALVIPEKIALYTGGKATGNPRPGEKFSAYDRYITGTHLTLEPGKRIVQAWRTTGWPVGVPASRLEISLVAKNRGTEVTMVHSEVPHAQAANYDKGWDDFYWTPLQMFFAKNRGKKNR